VLVVANLSRYAQVAELDLSEFRDATCRWRCSARWRFPPIGELPYMLTLTPHACFWLGAAAAGALPTAPPGEGHSLHDGPPPRSSNWTGRRRASSTNRTGSLLEGLLPSFLATRRWFGGKARTLRSAKIAEVVPTRVVESARHEARIVLVEVDFVEAARNGT
jgi:maltose alpha-D-glucosyltransferase / alpha-amylase